MLKFFAETNWTTVHTENREAVEPKYESVNNLSLSERTLTIAGNYAGIYCHQKEALRLFLKGENVCLATSTASGKSLAFHLSAMESIESGSKSKILAIYPAKALTEEQTKRWNQCFQLVDGNVSAGKIDGSVQGKELRLKILENNNVIVMTPDVVHAWLLKSAESPKVQNFLRNLRLLIVDEAHVYTGAFGSHAAFMFRRLRHLVIKCGGTIQVMAASATIHKPEEHLRKLLGENFSIVDKQFDSSGSYPLTICLVNPPDLQKLLDHTAAMLTHAAHNISGQFIAFVDSRKQAEYAAALMERVGEGENVRPFRAGYEENDRNEIQRALTSGKLKGVISTNALELGMDIPGISLGILIGVPASGTSLHQRIGRVGRRCPGQIVIVNDGSPHSALMFSEPSKLFELPLAESSLYLDNDRIQYAHAICLASPGVGEDDKIQAKSSDDEIHLECEFPGNFSDLCDKERKGLITNPALNYIRGQAGDAPHYNLPIRSVEPQYNIERDRDDIPLGRVSESQMLREAYPGAVYYYGARPYRIFSVDRMGHKIRARQEKKIFSTPKKLPEFISPDLQYEHSQSLAAGDFRLIETSANVLQRVTGFTQQKGSRKEEYNYPLNGNPVRYPNGLFSRRFSTSGVFLWSPLLNRMSHDVCGEIANLLFEAFVFTVPYDRQDVNFGHGRFKVEHEFVSKNDRFVAIYDQNLGSLRLSSRMMDHDVLQKCGDTAIKIAKASQEYSCESVAFLRSLHKEIEQGIHSVPIAESTESISWVNVIMPGSIGIANNNKRVIVCKIFHHPKDGICYMGEIESDRNVTMRLRYDNMSECEESEMGWFDPEKGEVIKT